MLTNSLLHSLIPLPTPLLVTLGGCINIFQSNFKSQYCELDVSCKLLPPPLQLSECEAVVEWEGTGVKTFGYSRYRGYPFMQNPNVLPHGQPKYVCWSFLVLGSDLCLSLTVFLIWNIIITSLGFFFFAHVKKLSICSNLWTLRELETRYVMIPVHTHTNRKPINGASIIFLLMETHLSQGHSSTLYILIGHFIAFISFGVFLAAIVCHWCTVKETLDLMEERTTSSGLREGYDWGTKMRVHFL